MGFETGSIGPKCGIVFVSRKNRVMSLPATEITSMVEVNEEDVVLNGVWA